MIVPPPWPSLTTVPLSEEETTEPSPPKTVEPDTREVPSHLAGEMVTPGTVLRDLEAESTMALSALEAKTSTEGTENRGMAGISPGRYPDTVGTDEAVADWVAAGVVGSAAGDASVAWGFEEPQAPRARAVAAMREAARVRRVMFMKLTVRVKTRGAHCSGNHVKPRNLKAVRGKFRVSQGRIRVCPGSGPDRELQPPWGRQGGEVVVREKSVQAVA